jgi:hypothetical protein
MNGFLGLEETLGRPKNKKENEKCEINGGPL